MLDPTAAACTVDFGASGVGGAVVASALSSSTTCQDCGNQAKKDCIHRRCRTCCKGRGLDCPTHVKSTWVPAARRRERQQHLSTAAGSTSASTSDSKRPRLLVGSPSNTTTSTSNTTPPPTSHDTSSCHQDAGFRESLPKNVKAPAVFKCVRVTSIDDGDDSFAYHAMVKIGGHIFKGFLYDQGADQVIDVDGSNTIDPTTHSSSRTKHNVDGNSGATPNLSGLHLGSGSADLIGAAAAGGGSGGGGGGHSDVYVAGDTEFANPLSC